MNREFARDVLALALALAGLVLTAWGTGILGSGMIIWSSGVILLGLAAVLGTRVRPDAAPKPDGLAPEDDDGRMEVAPERGPDTT